jgi:kinesin family protein 6/9
MLCFDRSLLMIFWLFVFHVFRLLYFSSLSGDVLSSFFSFSVGLFRDSLGGNCKTIMIATINPEASHTPESLSTCRFAQRVSQVKNKASINEEMDPNLIIKRLKGELLTLREEVAYLKGEAGEGEQLTPSALDEIRNSCRQYCYDRDPNAILNVGSLTLTKIKEVFQIMRGLVQEAIAEGGGGGRRNGGGGEGGNFSEHDGGGNLSPEAYSELEKQRKQVKELKAVLLQRDSEINILVNMVKKNKTIDIPDNANQDMIGEAVFASSSSANSSGQNSQKLRDGQPPIQKQAQAKEDDGRMSKELQQKILQRHLFNVPPPPVGQLEILDDIHKAQKYFAERHHLNPVIEENKKALADRIGEVKQLGALAENSRRTIEYFKKTIEQIRRDR